MRKEDFMDAMGELPDALLEQTDAARQRPTPQPARRRQPWIRVISLAACAALVVGIGLLAAGPMGKDPTEAPAMQPTPAASVADVPVKESDSEPSQDFSTAAQPFPDAVPTRLLSYADAAPLPEVTPSVPQYRVEPGLANVVNADLFYLSDAERQLLEENMFVVSKAYVSEFFEIYEFNRYEQLPNYVTVDSLMHTYHLYFSLLLSRTEREHLAQDLSQLSAKLLQTSSQQYDALRGTVWEEAACRNTAFFAVGAALLDPETELPSCAEAAALEELSRIYAAEGIQQTVITGDPMDYSQFKPRGYYEGDRVLEQYFRAMMWYGQVNFAQSDDSLTRSALLMTLAMAQTDLAAWERLYTVTTFFSGVSDDHGYYTYADAVSEAYGGCPSPEQLLADTAAYDRFTALCGQLPPPAINSVPVFAFDAEDPMEANKGFRFMGQRFTIDAAIMQQLVYRAVEGENTAGAHRMLPDVLDLPAALGSDPALELLTQQGETDYGGYSENMTSIREALSKATEEAWTDSLYSGWIYTLQPLLKEKGEGWPSYMTSEQWSRKSLETFAGSYTELKHDTVLYAKQVIAEMGGGPVEEKDDRGYVEPEPVVYHRFMLLARQTAEGLQELGMLSSADAEHLRRLELLAQQLMVISVKELNAQGLTEEEYDLIRNYGGTLEHFWMEAAKDHTGSEYPVTQEHPASLITDIATDPNGSVLQIATGRPAEILVVVPVDGTLRLASGMVYNFYQFAQNGFDRMTDTQWRQMIGEWAIDGWQRIDNSPEKPWWTQDYWSIK